MINKQIDSHPPKHVYKDSLHANASYRHWLKASLLATAVMLAGCGDTTTMTEPEDRTPVVVDNSEDTTDLVIAVTDAEEDFLSYTVSVNSILLTKDNGDQVEVLPARTTVDFVEYQELTELFSVVKAPVAKYQSVQIELDYSEAFVLIQDENGTEYEAQVLDADGSLVTTMVVDFQLERGESLDLVAGKRSYLTLDLDLSASNTIVSYEPAIVEVEPFVVGQIELDEAREHRVRGTVNSADEDAQTITLNLKPMRKKEGRFGDFVVQLDENSVIEIDGESVELAQGLAHLAAQNDTYPVVAFGVVNTDDVSGEARFIASQLLAGSSVPWANKDLFKGMISQLEDGVPYINGLMVNTEALSHSHLSNTALTFDETTTFTSRTALELDDSYLVPGQKISALGEYVEAVEDTENNVEATYSVAGEVVRLFKSEALGQITAIDDRNFITLDVSRFNKRPGKVIKRKNKKLKSTDKKPGTSNTELDLDFMSTLIVDVSGLSQLSLETGDWVKVSGLLNPETAESDMQVWSVVEYNVTSTAMKYSAFYGQTGTTPVISESADMMTIDLTTGRHKMNFRFNPVNMLSDVESLTLVAAADTGKFALAERGERTLFFSTFSELLASLSAKLATGGQVKSLSAVATINDDNTELLVTSLIIKLN